MMSVSTTLLCLALMLLAQNTYQISGMAYCPCLKNRNVFIQKENIQGYMEQKAGICLIDSVLFKTHRGFFCVDPTKPWVRPAIEYFNAKKMDITTARPMSTEFKSTEFKTETTG